MPEVHTLVELTLEALDLEELELGALAREALELQELELLTLELEVLGVPSSTGLTPPLLCPPPYQSQPPLQPASPLPAPSPYTERSGGHIERREPVSRPFLPVRNARRAPRARPPPVPGTHALVLHPSSVPLRVPLPAPPESSLPEVPDRESDSARAASRTVSRLLATTITDPSFESAATSALVAELVDFAAACRLDYATALVDDSAFASPSSVEGECALGTDVFEDRQEDFECLAAAVPRFASMMLALEGDPDAPEIPTPRSYSVVITVSDGELTTSRPSTPTSLSASHSFSAPPLASPTVSHLLATAVTDPSFESAAASALVAELVDFAAACRLDYATPLVAESASASPPSVGGENALGTDVFEDRQEGFECLAAAVPCFASMFLAPEGDPDAPDIPTPRSYSVAITGPARHFLRASAATAAAATATATTATTATAATATAAAAAASAATAAHATSGLILLARSAAVSRARVSGVVEVAAGVVVGAALEVVEAVEVVAAVGLVAGVGDLVAAVEAAVGVAAVAAGRLVVVGLELSVKVLEMATGSSSCSVGARPNCLSSFMSGCFSVGCLGVLIAARMSFARVTVMRPRWGDLLRSGVSIFDLDFDAILSVSAEGDSYQCVPPDPGIAAAALGATESGNLPCTAPAEALHTFTLDSGASRCFFCDSTTPTPLTAPAPIRLADPSGGLIVAHSSTVLPCPAVLSSSLSGLHLPSFSTNLVSTAALQDSMVTTTTPGGQRDLPVLRLHSDRGGEFSSDLLRDFCLGEGITLSFTLPASRQQKGIAERRIGLVMEVSCTSMIHAAAPHYLWPFVVRYAAHQLNLWPRVSFPETSPTLRWTGEVGDASVFWGPAPPGLSQVDPFPGFAHLEVAVGSRAASRGAASKGAERGGAESEGAGSGGAVPGAIGAEGTGDAGAGGARVTAGAGGTRGAPAAGPGGARTKGTRAAGTGGDGGARAGDPTEQGAAEAGGTGAEGAGVGGTGAEGAGVGGTGAGGAGAGGAGAVERGGTVRSRPYFCDSRDGVSLFDHTSGVSTAPATTADSTVRSKWTTRDTVARLAIRSHLPPAESAHFGHNKTAKSLYDAVLVRYSSPATAALSRLMLPYLFPDLVAFATVADLIAHLRTSDARYRAALPTEFCAKNPPPCTSPFTT
ncbi:unnamed protein product [Closterium sp. NIES-54]